MAAVLTSAGLARAAAAAVVMAGLASAQVDDDDDWTWGRDDDDTSFGVAGGSGSGGGGGGGGNSKSLTETQQLVLVLVGGGAAVALISFLVYLYTGQRRGQETLVIPRHAITGRRPRNKWSTWLPVGYSRRNLAARGGGSDWSSELSSTLSSSIIMQFDSARPGMADVARATRVAPTRDIGARVVGKRPSHVWDQILNHEPSTLGRDTVLSEPVQGLTEEDLGAHGYLTLQPPGAADGGSESGSQSKMSGAKVTSVEL